MAAVNNFEMAQNCSFPYSESHFSTPQEASFPPLAPLQLVLFGFLAFLCWAALIGPYKETRRLRHLRGPRGWPLLGSLVEIVRDGHHICLDRWFYRFGPVYKFYMGLRPQVVVSDPQYVMEIAVKHFRSFHNRPVPEFATGTILQGIFLGRDEYWTGIRNAILPLFHTQKLRNFGGVMHGAADRLVQKLGSVGGAETVNMADLVQAMTLDVLGTAAFGMELRTQDGEQSELLSAMVENIRTLTDLRASLLIALYLGPRVKRAFDVILESIPYSKDRQNAKRMAYLLSECEKIAAARRQDPEAPAKHDFLTMLTRAREKSSGRGLRDQEIRALVLEFLGAGSETTANTLAYAVYLLSQNPEVEAKVLAEIDAFYDAATCPDGEKGDTSVGPRPTYDELDQFPFVEQVVNETQRLLPTVALLSREANEDVTLGGMLIPKGAQVMIPLYTMHHDPKQFPEPYRFNPERFSPEAAKGRHPYAFIPFGLGPRMCIGYRFAMEEAKLALIRLYKDFRYRLDEERMGGRKLQIMPGIVLKPKDGVWVTVERRHRRTRQREE